MMIDLSKYGTKAEKHTYLVNNKADIIDFARQQLRFSDPFGALAKQKEHVKSLNTSYKDDPTTGVIQRTIIGNTYNWCDTYNDVLIDGCCAKTIAERAKKIRHLHDHEFKLVSQVGVFTSVYERNVLWSDLGVNKQGNTMCLMADSQIQEVLNKPIFLMYLRGEIDQHSIGFYYVKLALCLDDPDYKEEYAAWIQYIDRVGNKDKVIEDGYFWAVTEIKLAEISCVLEGSNELTPTVPNIQPEKSTDKEPVTTTQKKGVDWKYLTDNFKLN